MRDAAGQPADRLHLLRLPQALFEIALHGDVARDDDEARELVAIAGERTQGRRAEERRAVAAAAHAFAFGESVLACLAKPARKVHVDIP